VRQALGLFIVVIVVKCGRSFVADRIGAARGVRFINILLKGEQKKKNKKKKKKVQKQP
jgi:hypothetical protein